MSYPELLRERDLHQSDGALIPELTLQPYEQAFEIEHTYNSTAIGENTLTLIETKVPLEDGVTIGGKRLREIYETANHQRVHRYAEEYIAREQPLGGKIIKKIHALLMKNIFVEGVYRNVDVYISGAQRTPSSPGEIYRQVKDFYADLAQKGKEMSPTELAAWTHVEFVRIRPFPDDNGRTSRLVINYQLLVDGFPAVSIMKESRLGYFNALETYAMEGSLAPFVEMAADSVDHQMDRYLGMITPSQNTQQSLEM